MRSLVVALRPVGSAWAGDTDSPYPNVRKVCDREIVCNVFGELSVRRVFGGCAAGALCGTRRHERPEFRDEIPYCSIHTYPSVDRSEFSDYTPAAVFHSKRVRSQSAPYSSGADSC